MPRLLFRFDLSWPILIGFAAALCMLIVLPLSWLVYYSFHDRAGGFTLANFAQLVTDPSFLDPLVTTLILAGLTTSGVVLSTVRDAAGVLWVNDSKATNVESAVAALRSFPGRTIIWIGGGKGAGFPIDGLADEVALRARFAILNGASATELDAALALRGFVERSMVANLAEAVRMAEEIARPGDVVLLAPGFKSFDQFRDFEDRGDVFAALVGDLAHSAAGNV